MAILSAIIGAGFASGREIISFFGKNGYLAIPFFLLVAGLFFFCFYLFSKLGKMIKPKSIADMTSAMFGKVGVFVDFMFILCTFITLSSMLAGSDAIGTIIFGASYNFCYISIITAMLTVLVVYFGLKYIYKIANAIVPPTIAIILAVLVAFLIVGPKQQVSQYNIAFNGFSAVISCFLYVSMNVFTNIFIIAKSSQYMNKKQIGIASAICASVLLCLLVLVVVAVMRGGDAIFSSDMPMLAIATGLGGWLGVLYAVMLWLSIFTTLCIAGYTIMAWLNRYIKNKFICSVITLTLGFIFSRFGFSNIVDIFYPIEGIFGALLIVYCAVYYFKNKKSYTIMQQMGVLVQSNLQTNGKAKNKTILPTSIQGKQQVEPKSNATVQNKLQTKTQSTTADGLKSVKVEKKNGSVLITKKFSNGKITKSKK